jgi:hypothetical protein
MNNNSFRNEGPPSFRRSVEEIEKNRRYQNHKVRLLKFGLNAHRAPSTSMNNPIDEQQMFLR